MWCNTSFTLTENKKTKTHSGDESGEAETVLFSEKSEGKIILDVRSEDMKIL